MTGTLDGDGDGHMRMSLGLYVLGALDDEALVAIEEHLAACATCRAESVELSEVPVALAMLSEDDVEGLIQEYGAPAPPAPVQYRPEPATAVPSRPIPDTRASRGPTDRRPAGRSTGSRRRWRPAQVRVAMAACVAALVIGVGTGLWLNGGTQPTQINTVLTGESTDSATGATLAIVVTGHTTKSTVRATVSGLRPAIPYQLFAVTTDGRTLTVGQWLGTAAPQTVAGDIAATVPQIALFTVAQQDGAVIVSVRFGAARATTPAGTTGSG